MGRKVPLLPSVTVTLTSAVLLAVACVGLIQRERFRSTPAQQPDKRLDDDRDAGEEPGHQAPPLDYGHRVAITEPDAGSSKPKPTTAQVKR